MPAYKDLYDMVKKAIEAEMREMENMVELMSNEIREAVERESCLVPLYSELRRENELIYIVDVPHLKEETIYVKLNGQNLELSCTNSRGVKYRLNLKVPKELEGSEIKVSRVKGRITLRLIKANTK
ncbi:hypothetical protein L3N51_01180 [Metallosphaera sp. J1]|uniref:CS domain-containing protein n=1 Tax=Metallosphaera TaxID=41980 RepID=UPI001EDE8748|nr:CS domain-containing protein [Metallosphaera javensis (ex Hofmann et al. 2022)]MCG3108891.1 hypothetical protein [Metallosphaera javensis (ex Hofmann et al. 2022)]BCS94176.1 MAG: hypothetical protein MjAS7_2784 [Metallosphaera javensis (ex Sakai et al. 2022)]